jgi:hypothetical protein
MAVRRDQNDLGSPDELARPVAFTGKGLQFSTVAEDSGKGKCHRVS